MDGGQLAIELHSREIRAIGDFCLQKDKRSVNIERQRYGGKGEETIWQEVNLIVVEEVV